MATETKTAAPSSPDTGKPPIYLLDSMAFIFRAYHAMQRQRPMSTRTGIPTAATYVFVNMINKLRKDFAPQYLAAVYDLSAPVFRDERAREMKGVRKWNIKTQQFEVIDYAGYKANRAEMPADLAQQLPYIRRALEAFRIPILSYEGFEADDVIGTLSSKLSALGHRVFVVSSDKDMMQLVTPEVSILNPTKDNRVLDPAGVEASLGVPPERVIDVMALRGDSVDNIPGAPGIGDKGSVELIQQFGSVESALDAATAAPDSIKRKTYRESLQNNRDNIMLCKALVTMLKKLAPAAANSTIPYSLNPTAADIAALLAEARKPADSARVPHSSQSHRDEWGVNGLAIAIFEDARAIAEEVAAEPDPESPETEPEPPPPEPMDLFARPQQEIRGPHPSQSHPDGG